MLLAASAGFSKRKQSMSDRMRGRPGEVAKVAVKLGDQVL